MLYLLIVEMSNARVECQIVCTIATKNVEPIYYFATRAFVCARKSRNSIVYARDRDNCVACVASSKRKRSFDTLDKAFEDEKVVILVGSSATNCDSINVNKSESPWRVREWQNSHGHS